MWRNSRQHLVDSICSVYSVQDEMHMLLLVGVFGSLSELAVSVELGRSYYAVWKHDPSSVTKVQHKKMSSIRPTYEFNHGVKNYHKDGDGHTVKELYQSHEPDRRHRLVKYRSDKTGIRAHVESHGQSNHHPKGARSYQQFTLHLR